MSDRMSVSISLTPELLGFAERLLTAGHDGSLLSEMVRTAPRVLRKRELNAQAHRQARRWSKDDAQGPFNA